MKYGKMLGMICLVSIVLTGCSRKDDAVQTGGDVSENSAMNEQDVSEDSAANEQIARGDCSNLDLSLVDSEIALPEHLYEMESQGEGSWNDEKIYEEFPKLIAAYGGPKEDELNPGKDIIVETWIDGNVHFIPLEERKDEQIDHIKYCSDSLYIDMNSIRQIFTFHPDVVERITGTELDHQKVWMPNEHADPIAVYDIGKDDIENVFYNLDGEEVSLEESVKFVEKTLKDNQKLPYISTPGFEYRVEYVQVYQFGENHCYYFNVNLYYNGVKLDSELAGLETVNGKTLDFIGQMDRCSMFSKDDINGIYMFDFLNEKQDSIREVERNISYEDALQILSGYLSSQHVFKVLNAELVYDFYVEYGENETDEPWANGVNRIVPNWQFELSTEGIQQYSKLYIMINVQTGEVIENRS